MLFKNEIINMKKMKNGENENIVKLTDFDYIEVGCYECEDYVEF